MYNLYEDASLQALQVRQSQPSQQCGLDLHEGSQLGKVGLHLHHTDDTLLLDHHSQPLLQYLLELYRTYQEKSGFPSVDLPAKYS